MISTSDRSDVDCDPIQAGRLRGLDKRWGTKGVPRRERILRILRELPARRFVEVDRVAIAERAGCGVPHVHTVIDEAVAEGLIRPEKDGRDSVGRRLRSTRFRRIARAVWPSQSDSIAESDGGGGEAAA
jgi:hypothetical protein